MYEPLEACAGDFGRLQTIVTDPEAGARLTAIREALDATAQNIGSTTGTTESERDHLAKLYRGMLAASRIVAHLQSKQAAL